MPPPSTAPDANLQTLPSLPTLDALEAELARRRLRDYFRLIWPIIEPGTPLRWGWHIDCLCDHLQAVAEGEILDLLINIPPRHLKSSVVSVAFPTWDWATRPERRFLYASYREDLSIRDAVRSRRVIDSPWYQRHYGHVFQLTGDQNQKSRYENDKTGYRLSTSVSGGNTGEGGAILCADDPHNVKEAESDQVREGVISWWDEVMTSRRNDPKTSARVVVMQRVHTRDLSGHLAERGGYHHLVLPAEYEPRVTITMPGAASVIQPHDDCPIYADPRTEPGELLNPARIGADEITALKRDLGSYGFAGQYQQRPVPREGAMFHSDWFRPLPANLHRNALTTVSYYDLAFSEKTSADYTAGATVGRDANDNLYVLHTWRERIGEARLDEALAEQIAQQRPALVGIEEGAYKQAATQDLVRRVLRLLSNKGVPTAVIPVKVTTDKVFRAQLPAARAQAGSVYADRSAPWWTTFESELLAFPKGAHDDLVDSLSGAVQLVIEKSALMEPPPPPSKIVFNTGASGHSDLASNMPKGKTHLFANERSVDPKEGERLKKETDAAIARLNAAVAAQLQSGRAA